MNNKDYKSIAISKLLNCGYSVFTPISNNHFDYDYILEYANVLQTIKVLPIYYDGNTPKVRLTYSKPPRLRNISLLQLVACVRTTTKTVWLIPYEDVCLNASISLKTRYDSYILNEEVIINDKKTKSVFTEAAIDTANKLVKE